MENKTKTKRQEHLNRIRNGRIRRDFRALLEAIASVDEPDYSEIEAIARRNGFYYDDQGEVRDV